ncbi:pleckstrin homology domain-containing family A member 5-like isoform X1 [Stigmatopora nigra]
MKLWKKRWFVLSDLCLFYYRDEKEDSILGSILLPSFHISMLSVDDHISRKYAFKATHPNMRTYYFCTDTAKEMESWMKVMTDAALVKKSTWNTGKCPQIDMLDDVKAEAPRSREANNRVLSRPELENNQRNRVPTRHRSLSRADDWAWQKDGGRYGVRPEPLSYVAQKDGDKYLLREGDGEKYDPPPGQKYVWAQEGESLAPAAKKEVRRQLSLRESGVPAKYGTLQMVDKYKTLKDVRKYGTLREGDKYATLRDLEKYATLCHAGKRHFQLNGEHASEQKSQNQAGISATPLPAVLPVREEEERLSRSHSFRASDQSDLPPTARLGGTQEDDRSVTSYQTLPRNMPSHHHPQLVPRYPEGYRTLPRNIAAGSTLDRSVRPGSTGTATAAEKRRSMRDDTMWQLYEWQQRQAFSRQSMALPTGHYGTLPSTKTMSELSEYAASAATVPSIPASPSHGALAVYEPSLTLGRGSSSRSEAPSPNFREDGTLERQRRTQPSKLGGTLERRSTAGGVSPQPVSAQSLQGKTPEELTLMLIKLRRQQAELNSLREHTLSQLMALGIEGPNPKVPSDDYKNQSPEDTDSKLSRFCEQDKLVRMQEDKLQQLHREKHTLETALLSASQELSEQSHPSSLGTQNLIQQRDVLQNGLLSTCRELSRVNTELERAWGDYDRLEGDVILAKSNLLEQLEALGSPQTEPPSQRHIQIQKELWRIQDVMEALSKNKPQRTTTDNLDSKPLSSQQKDEAVPSLPLGPAEPGSGAPPRPPLPQYYNSSSSSSERPPHAPPRHPNSGGRPPPYTQREDRKSRNSQGPDYRLYKSEPELTTVNEEVDEVNGEDKEKDKNELPAEKNDMTVALYPVGAVSPRSKSPKSPPESTTIASYVTLRKTKKPEVRTDRPRSALGEQTGGYAEREVGRPRMSLEEQLERMRRHREASSQRDKRRETLSRSHSFSRDHEPLATSTTPPQAWDQIQGAGADPAALEAALEQVKMLQNERGAEEGTHAQDSDATTSQQEEHLAGEGTRQSPGRSPSPGRDHAEEQMGETQTAVILDTRTETRHVEIVKLDAFDQELIGGDHAPSSPTESRFRSSFPETSSPEPQEEDEHHVDVLPLQNTTEENHTPSSYKHLPENDKKINNNNLLAPQMLTLVSNDT